MKKSTTNKHVSLLAAILLSSLLVIKIHAMENEEMSFMLQIKGTCITVTNNQKLKYLIFKPSSIRFLTYLPNLESATHIDLTGCSLGNLPEMLFRRCTALQILTLAKNKLTKVPNLNYNILLQEVNLSHNQITAVPETYLCNHPELRKVHLHGNLLKKLPRFLTRPRMITWGPPK